MLRKETDGWPATSQQSFPSLLKTGLEVGASNDSINGQGQLAELDFFSLKAPKVLISACKHYNAILIDFKQVFPKKLVN